MKNLKWSKRTIYSILCIYNGIAQVIIDIGSQYWTFLKFWVAYKYGDV